MAQVMTAKKTAFVQRWSNSMVGLLAYMDQLNLLFTEATNDGFLSGGANQMVDADIQTVLPAATMALFTSSVGGIANANQVAAAVAANRQAFEWMRP